MKKLSINLLFCFSILSSFNSFSQSFSGKGSKQYLMGIGFCKNNVWYPENEKALKGHFNPLSTQITCKGEFGIGKYVGIGFSIGLDYSNDPQNGYYQDFFFNEKQFYSLNIPVGAFGNFHFLQLITDLTKTEFTKHFDAYLGIDLGSGPSFLFARQAYKEYGNDFGYLLYGGPYLGVRYVQNNKFNFYTELGSGNSYVNFGVVFTPTK